jgi:hypothetical protein
LDLNKEFYVTEDELTPVQKVQIGIVSESFVKKETTSTTDAPKIKQKHSAPLASSIMKTTIPKKTASVPRIKSVAKAEPAKTQVKAPTSQKPTVVHLSLYLLMSLGENKSISTSPILYTS